MSHTISRWSGRVRDSDQPTYRAIADAIADDIERGHLRTHEKLPPLRALADALRINFTTAARAYAEARQRGLIEGRQGRGSFVRGERSAEPLKRSSPIGTIDMSMNMPPEPTDTSLVQRLRQGFADLAREDDLYGLFRYQACGGTREDREAAAQWLANRLPGVDPANVLICPGAHGALLGSFAALARAGDTIACPRLNYPGIKGIAAHLGIRLAGLPEDGDGLDPEAFAALCAADPPKALYVNPTLHNPTTVTLSRARRKAIAEIAERYAVPIIEDDPYGCLSQERLPPIASYVPRLVFYVAGLSKVLGAGLRIGYLVLPNARYTARLTTTLASLTVMANPAMIRLATHWIADGTVRAMTKAIRAESRARQATAARILHGIEYSGPPEAFHLWLPVPESLTRVELQTRLQSFGLAAVAADTFTVNGTVPEALRICLGGATSQADCQRQLEIIRDAIDEQPVLLGQT